MARRYREEFEDSDIPNSVKKMRNNKNKKNNKNKPLPKNVEDDDYNELDINDDED